MATGVWIRKEDVELFNRICELDSFPYAQGIEHYELEGHIEQYPDLRDYFVLGRVIDKPDGVQYLHIKGNSSYPDGFILKPSNAGESQISGVDLEGEHFELADTDKRFIERVFDTYCSSLIAKETETDKHLLVYN